MRHLYQLITFSVVAILFAMNSYGQKIVFKDLGQNRTVTTNGKSKPKAELYRTFSINKSELKNLLWSLPAESDFSGSKSAAPVINIPMPDGSQARFRVWESSIQEPALAAKFPEIKTFAGQGVDDPYATIRFDYNPYFGFSAQILSPNGRIFIDPYAQFDAANYVSFYARDFNRDSKFSCLVNETNTPQPNGGIQTEAACLGGNLRTYRLAVACTGEYARNVSGNPANAAATHAAIVTSVNRVNGIYERELAIRLVLVANNNLIEYLDPTTDPYSNAISTALLNQNQINLDNVLGFANYDIGHVFSGDDSGLAQLNAVCGAGKARGATGRPNPIGDPFDVDYVAHEIGHQFGAQHTFNSNSCASEGGSYEPGGGTTIMAYAGICGAADNIQPNSDPVFHTKSFDDISNFIAGSGNACAVVTPTTNILPVIAAISNNGLSIPINTPFVLKATATDADSDPLTYSWEGWDVGSAGSWLSAANSTTRPLFRSRNPKTTGERTFPDIRIIAANYPGNGTPSAMDGLRGEILPNVARQMKFRVTVRDVHDGIGGVVSSGQNACQSTVNFVVNAVGNTPFAVTSPNGGQIYPAGSTQTVTWNNANTTAAPFNVANVRISLSVDGGLTYPHELLATTPNSGTADVTIPNTPTATARIKVEALGNIFFDISNNNFAITAPVPSFNLSNIDPVEASCPTPATLSSSVTATYLGGFTGDVSLAATASDPAVNFTLSNATLTPSSPSSNITITNASTLAPGSYSITLNATGSGVPDVSKVFTFVINPSLPVITQHPADASSCVGTNVTFTANSDAPNLQWQVSTNNGTNYTNINGATSNSLVLTNITAGLNGNLYRLVGTSLCGSKESNAAKLTVLAPPTITSQPANTAVCVGNAATFNVTATTLVGTLTYQWQFRTGAAAAWNTISGATTNSFTLSPTFIGQNGYQFRVIVTSGCGFSESNVATLTVNSNPVITFAVPAAPVCNSDLPFNLTASPAGGTFTGPGVTGNSFDPKAAGLGLHTIVYTVTVNGCTSTQSQTIQVGECAYRNIDLETYPAIKIAPIPNNGNFNILIQTTRYEKLNVRVFNALGQLVSKQDVSGVAYGSVIPVSLSKGLKPGVYQVVIGNFTDNKVYTRSIIIE